MLKPARQKPPALKRDKYKVVRSEQVTDLALLPGRFDRFAAEVRSSFEMLGDKLLPAITRIDEALHDISHRLGHIERTQVDHDRRLRALEERAKRRKAKP